MKLRKVLAILIAAVMVMGLFVACSGDDATINPTGAFGDANVANSDNNTPNDAPDNGGGMGNGSPEINSTDDNATDNDALDDDADSSTTLDVNVDGNFNVDGVVNLALPIGTEITTFEETEWDENLRRNVVLAREYSRVVSYCPVTMDPIWEHGVWQSFGRPGRDDGVTLLSLGIPVIALHDRNGHGDTTGVVNGSPFAGDRKIISGWAVFSVQVEIIDGVKAWFNICLTAHDEAIIKGAPGSWNLREKSRMADSDVFHTYTAEDFRDREAAWGGSNDPAFFAAYEAAPGEEIDLVELYKKLRAEGAFITWHPNLPELN